MGAGAGAQGVEASSVDNPETVGVAAVSTGARHVGASGAGAAEADGLA